MSILGWYALFALTTAIAAMYELFIPVIREYATLEPKDNLVEHKYLAYFVLFTASIITAPVLFPLVIIPALSTRFKKAMLDSLMLVPSEI